MNLLHVFVLRQTFSTFNSLLVLALPTQSQLLRDVSAAFNVLAENSDYFPKLFAEHFSLFKEKAAKKQ